MDAQDSYLNELVNLNKENYSKYPNIKWVNPYTSAEYQKIRDQLIENIGGSVLFNNTKPYHKQVSEGCSLCGAGLRSCLFITGKCNANCFHCPALQNTDHVPSSQGLTLPTASSYAEYVAYFKFKGASFSGGEPLLETNAVFDYLKEIRKVCSPDIYTWIVILMRFLANENIFRKLATLNLNEVRFDIGATAYSLDKIKYAKGIIPNISIEIPAIPEEKRTISEIIIAGDSQGRSKQLKPTPIVPTEYNESKLLKHNYTFIPAEKTNSSGIRTSSTRNNRICKESKWILK